MATNETCRELLHAEMDALSHCCAAGPPTLPPLAPGMMRVPMFITVFTARYQFVARRRLRRRRLDGHEEANGTNSTNTTHQSNATYLADISARLTAAALAWLQTEFAIDPSARDVSAATFADGVELNVTVWDPIAVTPGAVATALGERALAVTLCLEAGWCAVEADVDATMAPVVISSAEVYPEEEGDWAIVPAPASPPADGAGGEGGSGEGGSVEDGSGEGIGAMVGCPPDSELCQICPSLDAAGKAALASVLGCPDLALLCQVQCAGVRPGGVGQALSSGGGQALTSGIDEGGLNVIATITVLFLFGCLILLLCVLLFLHCRTRRALKAASNKKETSTVETQTDGLEVSAAPLPPPGASSAMVAALSPAELALIQAVSHQEQTQQHTDRSGRSSTRSRRSGTRPLPGSDANRTSVPSQLDQTSSSAQIDRTGSASVAKPPSARQIPSGTASALAPGDGGRFPLGRALMSPLEAPKPLKAAAPPGSPGLGGTGTMHTKASSLLHGGVGGSGGHNGPSAGFSPPGVQGIGAALSRSASPAPRPGPFTVSANGELSPLVSPARARV